jgi:hypothetical protein
MNSRIHGKALLAAAAPLKTRYLTSAIYGIQAKADGAIYFRDYSISFGVDDWNKPWACRN